MVVSIVTHGCKVPLPGGVDPGGGPVRPHTDPAVTVDVPDRFLFVK